MDSCIKYITIHHTPSVSVLIISVYNNIISFIKKIDNLDALFSVYPLFGKLRAMVSQKSIIKIHQKTFF